MNERRPELTPKSNCVVQLATSVVVNRLTHTWREKMSCFVWVYNYYVHTHGQRSFIIIDNHRTFSWKKKKYIYIYIYASAGICVVNCVRTSLFSSFNNNSNRKNIQKKSGRETCGHRLTADFAFFFKNFILNTWKRLLISFQNQHVYLKRKNGGNLFCCCCCCCYRSPSLGSDSMDERREYHYHDENNRSNTSVDHEVPEIYIPQPEFLTRMPTSELRWTKSGLSFLKKILSFETRIDHHHHHVVVVVKISSQSGIVQDVQDGATVHRRRYTSLQDVQTRWHRDRVV